MVGRIPKPGDTSSTTSYPTQVEAQAYFARMSVAPSAAYKDAVNTAIYKWKQLGVWTSIIQLIVFAADTSQAALLDLTANVHNATITGSPTFTANKGFSGFNASNGIAFGLDGTILVNDSFISVFAGLVQPVASGPTFIDNVSDSSLNTPGNFGLNSQGGVVAGSASNLINPYWWISSPPSNTIGGAKNTSPITTTAVSGGGTNGGRKSNYKTALTASHPLTRLLAYGAIGSAVSIADGRRFFLVLQSLLEAVAAFD